MIFNYSIEIIKKSMFIDELSKLKIIKEIDNNKENDTEVIINYLEKIILMQYKEAVQNLYLIQEMVEHLDLILQNTMVQLG